MDYDSDSELRATDTLRLDSDSDDENLSPQPIVEKSVSENISKLINVTRGVITSAIVSTDQLDEKPATADNDSELLYAIQTVRRAKVSKIIDSDSEDSIVGGNTPVSVEVLTENPNKSTINGIKSILDSDSDSNDQPQKYKPRKKLSKKKTTSSSSSTEVFPESDDEQFIGRRKAGANILVKVKRENQAEIKKLPASVTTAKDILSSLNLFFDDDDDVTVGKQTHKAISSASEDESIGDSVKTLKPIQKMTTKQAMEERQIIQSESQRMAREMYIDVPYHRTKSYSFEEFLARKTIRKPNPSLDCLGSSTDMSIKMTSEQLEAFARHLKERELESQEFFKPESESSDGKTETDTTAYDEATKKPEASAMDSSERNTEQVAHSERIEEEILPNTSITFDENVEAGTKAVQITEHDDPIDQIVNRTSQNMENPICTVQENVPSNQQAANDMEIKYDLLLEPSEHKTIATKKASLIAKQSLPPCPRLTGSSDMVIDLDNGNLHPKELSSADVLLQRLAKCSGGTKRSTPSKSTVNILSTDDGAMKLDKISLFAEEERPLMNKEPIPGAALLKLREALKEKIDNDRRAAMRKREDDFAKKMEMAKMETSHETDQDEEELTEDENCEEFENERETDVAGQHKNFLNDEATEDAVGAKDDEHWQETSENNSSVDEDDDEISSDGDNKRKRRIVKAFEDSDDEDVPALLQDVVPTVETEDQERFTQLGNKLTSTINCNRIKENGKNIALLWKDGDEENAPDDDLMALCSGRFGTQLPSCSTDTLTQLTHTPDNGNHRNADEHEGQSTPITLLTQAEPSIRDSQLMELCSGRFETQYAVPLGGLTHINVDQNENSAQNNKAVTSNDSDILAGGKLRLDSSDDETEYNGIRGSKKSKKRRRKHINLTDDEDESDYEQPETDTSSQTEGKPIQQDDDDDEKEEIERYVDYDSEENEIEVKLSKKEKKGIIGNFVENEAELSESEWGSADEDEKDLDHYDIEVADEEQFDQNQLQQELEKIHNRQMLDQDNREVEQLKEFFLEDEENDGVGRVRQFRWKNVEKTFSLDYDKEGDGEEDETKGEASDEETELVWRKMRHERNMLLKEQNIDPNVTEMSNATLLNPDDTTAATDREENNHSIAAGKRKITIVKRTMSASAAKEDNPFLISNSSILQGHKASFLSRDAETLNKLANIIKSNPETEGSTTVVAAKGRNFVFAALSPAIDKPSKRSLDSEDAEEKANIKKAKTTSKETIPKKRLLLDSLF